jgi:hypothetical protein
VAIVRVVGGVRVVPDDFHNTSILRTVLRQRESVSAADYG